MNAGAKSERVESSSVHSLYISARRLGGALRAPANALGGSEPEPYLRARGSALLFAARTVSGPARDAFPRDSWRVPPSPCAPAAGRLGPRATLGRPRRTSDDCGAALKRIEAARSPSGVRDIGSAPRRPTPPRPRTRQRRARRRAAALVGRAAGDPAHRPRRRAHGRRRRGRRGGGGDDDAATRAADDEDDEDDEGGDDEGEDEGEGRKTTAARMTRPSTTAPWSGRRSSASPMRGTRGAPRRPTRRSSASGVAKLARLLREDDLHLAAFDRGRHRAPRPSTEDDGGRASPRPRRATRPRH